MTDDAPERPGRPDDADARVFFGRHAADYAQSEGHRTGADLEMIVAALAPLAGAECLDIATGTGFCALALARAGARVTALDMTAEMLSETASLFRREGADIALAEGDATALPFPDRHFDRVTCRRAAHHFDDVDRALAEALRVLRPGGWAAFADMAPPAAGAGFQNAIERLRDPSHRRALGPEEWQAAFEGAGFEAIRLELWQERQDHERWYYPVTDPERRARVEAALTEMPEAAARALGHRREAGGGWSLVKQRVVITGRRPA